jgi:hypothetical protein
VPGVCRWQNTDGKSIILVYQGDYGEDMVLPDGKTVMSINFTGDNRGPHTLEQVKAIYANLRKKYPEAEIFGSTLNAVAEEMTAMSSLLPTVTSEIGDTWIYGYASSPLMIAQFRALSRLYTEWVQTGKIDPKSETAIHYAVRLGMVAEHTWGLDIKTFLKNWDKYDVDAFNASRNLPEFRFVEESWKEKAGNIQKAIALLPANLQSEANAAINTIGRVTAKTITKHDKAKEINPNGTFIFTQKGVKMLAGEITYQTFSKKDYDTFYEVYIRNKQRTGGWASGDFGKPGLENSKAQSATITAQATNIAVGKNGKDKQIDCLLSFPAHPAIDKRILPGQVNTQYILQKDGAVEMTVSLINKPANRLPEAYWVSFLPSEVVSVFVEKLGEKVDVMDVVEGGNRQMHGIDRYVDIITTKGAIRITSLDAPIVVVGERNALNYSTTLPDLSKGIHFCLSDNLWGTNFAMWWEGNISYRFKIEALTNTKNTEVSGKPAIPQLNWGSADIRYPNSEEPVLPKTTRFSAKAWKGERVNAQAVLWTKEDLSGVTVTADDLKCGTSVIPSSAVKTNFVSYVMTDELNKNGKGGCGDRQNKAEWDSSMVADILDINKIIDLKANTAQAIWVNVWAPADTKAGKYKGTLTVSGKNFAPISLNLDLEVLNRTLPPPKDWQFHLDLWQNPYAVARYYQVPLWSQAHFDAMRPIMKILADAGQKVITTTIMNKPWNGQTEDAFDAMVGKTKKIDGSWSYDYTVFDKWVEFMQSVGIDKQINCYTLIPWALRFDYFDQATNRVLFLETKPGEAAYDEYWGSFLTDFAKHLRQKGWFEKTTIAMDERGLEAMTKTIKLIKSIDSGFKISLAGNYHSEIEKDLYDLCISFGHKFPDKVKEEREKAGKVSTVYTCCAEARPNTFTFSPPAEATWIGWHAMAGNYDGYLRWSYNSWTADPLHDSRFRTWAAGDCYLVYPGGSSIRMERLIEGIQDYEKCRILKAEYTRKGETAKLDKLNRLIAQFTIEALTSQGAEKMVENAEKELNNP